jgi:hypothetical protein
MLLKNQFEGEERRRKLRFAWLLEEERLLGFQEGVLAPLNTSLTVFSTKVYNNCGNNYNIIGTSLRLSQKSQQKTGLSS